MTSSLELEIVGLGEVLWDLLPSGKVLGGAPFNFTFHCHQLGHPAVVFSRVGTDALGEQILTQIRLLGLSDEFVQRDEHHPTGTVSVQLHAGQPTYTIHENVAWDYLAWDDRLLPRLQQAKVVCFGTLIQRHPVARSTVQRLLKANTGLRVYDVNLRQHYFDREILELSLHASDWVKLNDEELIVLRDLLGLSGINESSLLADLRTRYHLTLTALTRGARGCLVQTADAEIEEPGIPVQVVDTIGAGDAFTAGLVCTTLEGQSVLHATRFANRLAAKVASCQGGTPRLSRADLACAE